MITLSPGRILMKFILIFPDTCVRTEWLWFFTSATRNMAFGRDSFTIASTRIGSSFGIIPEFGPFSGTHTIGIDPGPVKKGSNRRTAAGPLEGTKGDGCPAAGFGWLSPRQLDPEAAALPDLRLHA